MDCGLGDSAGAVEEVEVAALVAWVTWSAKSFA